MSKIIDLGCRVADVHQRYQAIHSAIFGAASYRLILDVLRGRRALAYREHAESLERLRGELGPLGAQIAALVAEAPHKGVDREIQRVMLEYTEALDKTIAGLETIFVNLVENESRYRDTGSNGRSAFTRDKVRYDRLLLDLERLGTRLNKLFANY